MSDTRTAMFVAQRAAQPPQSPFPFDAALNPEDNTPMTAPARLPATNICGDRIGTEAGAARHYRAGETACPPCRAGERQAKAARKAARKARKATSKEIGAQNAKAKTIKTLGYDPWARWETEKAQRVQNIVDYLKENQ